jgi:type II secretory pathway predicted ATPase ExeA
METKKMRADVLKYYDLSLPLSQAGYYETEYHQQLFRDVKGAILEGRLIALCGVVGSGKTVTLRRLQESLRQEGKVIVSKSLAVEKSRISLATLISALFYDVSTDKNIKIPSHIEKRDRDLSELIRRVKRPVALFVDEAHDLRGETLVELKRLLETAEDGGGKLSVVLAGHPKLRNDLRRPTMEEIGYRTMVFSLEGVAGSQREYIQWLLERCTNQNFKAQDLITDEAIDLLASKLKTPLQIQQYLTLAFEAGYLVGERPVSEVITESVLSNQIDDLEPTLTRQGYKIKDIAELCHAKPAEIKALFRNQLDAARAKEIRDHMLEEGLPIVAMG